METAGTSFHCPYGELQRRVFATRGPEALIGGDTKAYRPLMFDIAGDGWRL